MPGEPPQFETVKDENFRTIFVTGAIGHLTGQDGQVILFFDQPDIKAGKFLPDKGPEMLVPVIKRVFVIDVRMSPDTFRSLASWMAQNVKNYDEQIAQGKKPDPGPSYG